MGKTLRMISPEARERITANLRDGDTRKIIAGRVRALRQRMAGESNTSMGAALKRVVIVNAEMEEGDAGADEKPVISPGKDALEPVFLLTEVKRKAEALPCWNCEEEIAGDSIFCPNCGSVVDDEPDYSAIAEAIEKGARLPDIKKTVRENVELACFEWIRKPVADRIMDAMVKGAKSWEDAERRDSVFTAVLDGMTTILVSRDDMPKRLRPLIGGADGLMAAEMMLQRAKEAGLKERILFDYIVEEADTWEPLMRLEEDGKASGIREWVSGQFELLEREARKCREKSIWIEPENWGKSEELEDPADDWDGSLSGALRGISERLMPKRFRSR